MSHEAHDSILKYRKHGRLSNLSSVVCLFLLLSVLVQGAHSEGPVCQEIFTLPYNSLTLANYYQKFARTKERDLKSTRDEEGAGQRTMPEIWAAPPWTYYKRPRDFIAEDTSQGLEKLAAYEELGFTWREHFPVAPEWIDFYRMYIAALKRRGVPREKQVRPALVFVKRTIDPTRLIFGQPKINREYLLIDPFLQAAPDPSSGFEILLATELFNLPVNVMIKALAEGKWPLMDALHDTAHFIAFLRYPEFAEAVRARLAAVKPEELTDAFKQRLFYMMETLTVPDSHKRREIEVFLRSHGIAGNQSLASLGLRTSQMRDEDLIAYSQELARFYLSVLTDHSGGTSNSTEKYRYYMRVFAAHEERLHRGQMSALAAFVQANILIKNTIVPSTYRRAFKMMLFTYSSTGLAYWGLSNALHENDDARLLKEIASSDWRDQKELLVHSRGQDYEEVLTLRSDARENLLKTLREMTPILEYTLSQGSELDLPAWVNALLQPVLDESSPVVKLLRASFHSDSANQLIFGP